MNERRVKSSERPAVRKNIREDWVVQECVVAFLIGDDDDVSEDVLHGGSDTFDECRIAELEERFVRSHSAACAARKNRSRDVLRWNHVPLTMLPGGETACTHLPPAPFTGTFGSILLVASVRMHRSKVRCGNGADDNVQRQRHRHGSRERQR